MPESVANGTSSPHEVISLQIEPNSRNQRICEEICPIFEIIQEDLVGSFDSLANL